MSTDKGSIFDDPVAAESAEARLLAAAFYRAVSASVQEREASQPFDPKKVYGSLDINQDWSKLSSAEKQPWLDAASEWIRKCKKGEL